MADLQSIHLTSDSAVDTQQKLNSNFTEIEQRKVDNALKTGSETEYKVLSDNNYTDEDKNKVDNALSNTTKYGSSIDLTYTASTGVLGLSLKDQDGTELSSDNVDLPMELIIESGTVETCIENDEPVTGYVVGDKYLDLVLANENHIYVLVTDLVDQITINNTGSGNAVTSIIVDGSVMTVSKDKTFVEKTEITFTDTDEDWSALDEDGFYTLTKTSTKTPISNAKKLVSGTTYSDVLATVSHDGTNIYVVTDTKFTGKVIAI